MRGAETERESKRERENLNGATVWLDVDDGTDVDYPDEAFASSSEPHRLFLV